MMVNHVSEEEEQYFKQKELELLKKWEKERIARMEAENLDRTRKLHHCKCPKCYGDLREIMFKKKIRIDRCEQCGGVWLDSGELETLAGKKEIFISSFIKDFMRRQKESA